MKTMPAGIAVSGNRITVDGVERGQIGRPACCPEDVLIDGLLAGRVTNYRIATNRWSWTTLGGIRSPVLYPTRALAVAWLVAHPTIRPTPRKEVPA